MSYIRKIELQDFAEDLFKDIRYAEPFGINIPKPLFYCASGVSPSTRLFGKSNEHLKLHYQMNEAVAFFRGSLIKEISNNKQVHALYSTFCNHNKTFLIHSIKVN